MSEKEFKFVSLCEDTVHVSFYSLELLHSDIAEWELLCENINKTLKSLTYDYIWHKEDMKVSVTVAENKNDIPVCLESTTCFGDNIEDEWFIVYLVKEISKQHKHLIIQLEDNDGEFLLIESANYLPTWANPGNTVNRVFLYNQHIHVIPPTMVTINTKLKLLDAIKLISQNPAKTKVSSQIEKAIFHRISQYPEKIIDSFHNAIVRVPLDVAALLTIKPSLISLLVDAYCNHDVTDQKMCHTLEFNDTVLGKVKFTKCLYAMLMHARLYKSIQNLVFENNKMDILGLKLTCGLCMIRKRTAGGVFSTKEFTKYIKNLIQNGYFLENIEHSKEYNDLMEKAKRHFLETKSPINFYLSTSISEVMASDEFLKLKDDLRRKDISAELLNEDSDDWLQIHPNQLNELLQKQYNENINFNKDELVTPDTITSTLSDFLKQTSDYEGVETHALSDSNPDVIEFDSGEFINCLEKMMNLLSSDKNEGDTSNNSSCDSENDQTDEDDLLEKELASKLHSMSDDRKSIKTVMLNLTQSIKEEGLSGPSSNLLKTIPINRTDSLDSDDD